MGGITWLLETFVPKPPLYFYGKLGSISRDRACYNIFSCGSNCDISTKTLSLEVVPMGKNVRNIRFSPSVPWLEHFKLWKIIVKIGPCGSAKFLFARFSVRQIGVCILTSNLIYAIFPHAPPTKKIFLLPPWRLTCPARYLTKYPIDMSTVRIYAKIT